MKIFSTTFSENRDIPQEYTCDGDNINPPLSITDVPEEAKSLVLIVDDPDAPQGTFTHWIVFNIDPKIEEIGEDEIPKGGIEGINDTSEKGYIGPCPPVGTHHYIFHLYALDKTLDLKGSVDRADVDEAMSGYIIAEVQFTGLYSRDEEEKDTLRELAEDQEE